MQFIFLNSAQSQKQSGLLSALGLLPKQAGQSVSGLFKSLIGQLTGKSVQTPKTETPVLWIAQNTQNIQIADQNAKVSKVVNPAQKGNASIDQILWMAQNPDMKVQTNLKKAVPTESIETANKAGKNQVNEIDPSKLKNINNPAEVTIEGASVGLTEINVTNIQNGQAEEIQSNSSVIENTIIQDTPSKSRIKSTNNQKQGDVVSSVKTDQINSQQPLTNNMQVQVKSGKNMESVSNKSVEKTIQNNVPKAETEILNDQLYSNNAKNVNPNPQMDVVRNKKESVTNKGIADIPQDKKVDVESLNTLSSGKSTDTTLKETNIPKTTLTDNSGQKVSDSVHVNTKNPNAVNSETIPSDFSKNLSQESPNGKVSTQPVMHEAETISQIKETDSSQTILTDKSDQKVSDSVHVNINNPNTVKSETDNKNVQSPQDVKVSMNQQPDSHISKSTTREVPKEGIAETQADPSKIKEKGADASSKIESNAFSIKESSISNKDTQAGERDFQQKSQRENQPEADIITPKTSKSVQSTQTENIENKETVTSVQNSINSTEQKVSVDDVQSGSARTFEAQLSKASPAAPSESAARSSAPVMKESVIDQVVPNLTRMFQRGETRVEMQLFPKELGSMKVEVLSDKGLVTANFRVENQDVRQIVEAALPELRQSLEKQGIEVDQIQVNVNKDSQSLADQSQNSNRSWKQNDSKFGEEDSPHQERESHPQRDGEKRFGYNSREFVA